MSLKNNLVGKGKLLSEGIAMTVLRSTSGSTTSLSTLSTGATSGSAASSNVSYKQLARTEREAELESGDQFVL